VWLFGKLIEISRVSAEVPLEPGRDRAPNRAPAPAGRSSPCAKGLGVAQSRPSSASAIAIS
jgi:hypothetical protein